MSRLVILQPKPNHDFQNYWNKQQKEDNNNINYNNNSNPFLTVDIATTSSPTTTTTTADKDHTRTTRQLSYLCLIKLHHITIAFLHLLRTITRRIINSSSSYTNPSRFYKIIKSFLTLVMLLLMFELIAYFKGWHFEPPSVNSATVVAEWLYAKWLDIRVHWLAPPLQMMADGCILLFLVQSVDRIVLILGCFWIKFRRLKPVAKVDYADEGFNVDSYPMVLVQIPMCNERECYQQSIGAVCVMDWPKERMLVQILDDSSDSEVQNLIKSEVQRWQQRGVHIIYRHRLLRTGYKAGNLKSAMGCDYVKDYEFVAIFDADFQPTPDFLKKTIPHFKGNDDLALVQTRWAFVNKDENLLTRLQNINLAFHFEVEQQVNGVFINFFGFNGTAGVWRIQALEESGGWLERTTVEDMDIAVRAHLCGWKFIYLNDVECLCELPESYEAYKKQQYRWHSGPMQLFRLCFFDILRSKLPAWVVCYVPGIMSILNILPAPKAFPFIVPYLLFENTMSVTKFNAMISGLFRLGSSYEWIVTKKLGRSSENDLVAFAEKESAPLLTRTASLQRSSSESVLDDLNKIETAKKIGKTTRNRLYRKELALAFILLTAAVRSLLSAQGIHFYFLLFQGVTFLVVGLDLIGEQSENITLLHPYVVCLEDEASKPVQEPVAD
ncbi:hypothetical protein ACFE04_001660 [Oxalis oulophora]